MLMACFEIHLQAFVEAVLAQDVSASTHCLQLSRRRYQSPRSHNKATTKMSTDHGLVRRSDMDGRYRFEPANASFRKLFNLISTSNYILRTFFPSAVHEVLQYPGLLFALRIVLENHVVTKYFSAGLVKVFEYALSFLACSVSLDGTRKPFYDLQHLMSTKRTHKSMTSTQGETAYQMLQKDRSPRLWRGGLNNDKLHLVKDNGVEIFVHKGRLFLLKLAWSEKSKLTNVAVWTLGRSTDAIGDLMADAHTHAFDSDGRVTKLWLSDPGSYYPWKLGSRKPIRPLTTVDLEYSQKNHLLEDVAEFLDQETMNWYRHRSIPYRRGYLFHGKYINKILAAANKVPGKPGTEKAAWHSPSHAISDSRSTPYLCSSQVSLTHCCSPR